MRLLNRIRLIDDERGIALVMALGMMTVLGIMLVTVIDYTSSNTRNASYSGRKTTAFDLADAGMNNAAAVLNLPTNNALSPSLLPSCSNAQSSWNHNSYGNGTVDWCGDLDRSAEVWTLKSIGSIKNPTGPKAGNVTRTLSAKISVVPTYTQPLNNPSWNYMYATHTGSACDETLSNNVGGGSWM